MNGKGNVLSVSLLFFLSLIIMARQLGTTGYFACIIEDTFTFSSWAWQFTEALKEGIVYPRWVPLSFWGYGSPVFILYSPLAFYMVSSINVFTHSTIVAMNVSKFMALFLSGVGMYFLVKEFHSETISRLSASLYIIFPYNIFEFYYIGSFASVISLVWFSPLLVFTYRYIKNKRSLDIVHAGICYGGLILTHLINAYMFTVVLALFVIYMSMVHKRPRDLIAIPLTMFIGTLISAAYISPLILEKQFVNLPAFTGTGGFNFSDFFILPDLTAKLPADNYWPVYYKMFIFYLFFFCILIVLLFLQTLKIRAITGKDLTPINKFFIGVTAGSIFLLFGASTFIWETIPFFKYIQFPTRWLNITVFAIIFLSSAGFLALEDIYKRRKGRYFVIAGLFLVALLLDLRYIRYAPVFTEHELVPVKAVNYATEHLPSGITIDGIDKNSGEKDKVVITDGEGETEVISWKSAERIIKAAVNGPVTLRVRTFNFPGWTAYKDGVKTEIRTEEGTGAILVGIPQGRHTLELRFVDTPIRFYSKIISLVSFLAFTFLAVFLGRKGNKEK